MTELERQDNYIHSKDIETYTSFEEMPMFDCDNPNMELLQGIMNYGFTKPSLIQEIGIVPLSQGYNMIAQSQAGTGKTGVFVIGTLANLDPQLNHVQIVVIAPTHELATQTHHVYSNIAGPMLEEIGGVAKNIELCVGKQVSVESNIMNIKSGSKIIIGTPGRLLHLVKQDIRRDGRKQPLIDPQYVKTLILDEADKLLAQDSKETINNIVDILDDPHARKRRDYLQLGIFSATFNNKETLDDARRLCLPEYDRLREEGGDWMKHPNAPKQILLEPEKLTLDNITQYYFDLECSEGDYSNFRTKVEFIEALNSEHMIPTCIIYVNNTKTAIDLCDELNNINMVCDCIYGSLPARQRMDITYRFRMGKTRILISTDLLARGFDVRQVALVINFDLPYVYDTRRAENNDAKIAEYLHRIGRSGRLGRKGVAINLLATSSDHTRKQIIEDYYGVKMQNLPENVSSIY